jgi:transposase InsO family protein
VRRYQLIDQEKAHHTVSRLARVLGVARAGYYAWSSRPASVRTLADRALPEQIRQLHARSRGTDGAPRVHAELRLGLDVHVGRKRVARLMRAAGLKAAIGAGGMADPPRSTSRPSTRPGPAQPCSTSTRPIVGGRHHPAAHR